MKITGLKRTIAELKRVEANNNFARIYVNKETGEVFAIEYINEHGRYNDIDAVEIMSYDAQYRYGKRAKRPTMPQIKDAAEKAVAPSIVSSLYDLVELINNSEDYPIEQVEAAIKANGWIDTSYLSDYDVCSNRNQFISLNADNAEAEIHSELERTNDEDVVEFFREEMTRRLGLLNEWDEEHCNDEDYEDKREEYKKFLCI